jgi:hypothetical protein
VLGTFSFPVVSGTFSFQHVRGEYLHVCVVLQFLVFYKMCVGGTLKKKNRILVGLVKSTSSSRFISGS